MNMHWFTVSISLFLLLHSSTTLPQHWPRADQEKHSDDLTLTASSDNSGGNLRIRIVRDNPFRFSSLVHHHHQRRETMNAEDNLENIAEEIFGMAKKVAITIIILVCLCIICCLVSTVYICVRCCCGSRGTSRQKRNVPMMIQVPQPVLIHSNSPTNYPPQQQASTQWLQETHPMLPAPSAPPQPVDDFIIDRPPPYEKICPAH